MTHPRTFAPPIEQVLNQLATVQSLFHVADDTHEVTAQLLTLLQSYPTRGKQIHDANIVATMRANNIDTLLTLNYDDTVYVATNDELGLVPDGTTLDELLANLRDALEAINKASAREKSIRHGHPSTLHLWWARRPLAVDVRY